MRTPWIVGVAVLLTTTPALAQGVADPRARALFQQADLDGNARLSRIEFEAARESLFARVDANQDGRVTLAEARAARPAGLPRLARLRDRSLLAEIRAVDRNRDRVIDIAEFRALGRGRFRAADLDQDGFLSRREIDLRPRAFDWGG